MCVCVVGGGVGAPWKLSTLTQQPLIRLMQSERNPAITHPSLFLFSCLNSNHREFPYCCGKACVCVYLCEQHAYSTVLSSRSPHSITHTHTHSGDFPVNPGKRGILVIQLLMQRVTEGRLRSKRGHCVCLSVFWGTDI